MSQPQTVSAVSKNLGISSRMLRYYEQVGLIESQRADDYAYRVYNESAVRRLRQIIILRKLRVPVKQIREIFDNNDAANVVEVFERNISELDEQITALSTVKSILARLVQELQEKANMRLQLDLLGDSSVFAVVDSISFPKNTVNDDMPMEDINRAFKQLNRLTDRDVRIVYLPPASVAAYQCTGPAPEENAGQVMGRFVQESGLAKIKPDLRHYGFNCPATSDGQHGYEVWVTTPDGFSLPPPLVAKQFEGGLYAAHMIPAGSYDEWNLLFEWLKTSETYEIRQTSQNSENMNGLLEETLNYINLPNNPTTSPNTQLDLLIPIQEKNNGGIKMNKYGNAIKLLQERCGNADKDNVIGLATIALTPDENGNPYPSNRMVSAYYEDGVFYISTAANKNKTAEIEKNNHVAICGLDWFVATGKAENLGWVKAPHNAEIRAKMKKVFVWFDDHGNEDDPGSIVIKITIEKGTIIDNEQKYGQWRYDVDFVNKVAK
ncbi:MAG: effector binding domain-containing protein [Defluviitaleaceae bacterium]|nr:effector binding domain-containing protein [Defluviitaleaceae bacterium]